jgi:hypothetical protein
MSLINNLPQEVFTIIFSELPPKEIHEISSVCKIWSKYADALPLWQNVLSRFDLLPAQTEKEITVQDIKNALQNYIVHKKGTLTISSANKIQELIDQYFKEELGEKETRVLQYRSASNPASYVSIIDTKDPTIRPERIATTSSDSIFPKLVGITILNKEDAADEQHKIIFNKLIYRQLQIFKKIASKENANCSSVGVFTSDREPFRRSEIGIDKYEISPHRRFFICEEFYPETTPVISSLE